MWNVLGIGLLLAVIISFIDDFKRSAKKKKDEMISRAKKNKEIQMRFLEYKKQCNDIKKFSICLSIDYKVRRKIEMGRKLALNRKIFEKMAKALCATLNDIAIKTSDDSLVIISENFSEYDVIYDKVLTLLSKVKAEVDNKHEMYLIPSITTDAYRTNPEIERIKKNHKNIKQCDFVGASCSTNTFNKKYKFMNLYKNLGKPLGEYFVLDNKENSYELNMVQKNLSRQLESLGQ